MINQKKIRTLLKKTEDKFITKAVVARILKLDNNDVIGALAYLEQQGFIETTDIYGVWQRSLRGKLLSNSTIGKEYKISTLQNHLENLVSRAKKINASKKFPHKVTCLKVTSEYPIQQRCNGIHVAYTLGGKDISDKEYREAANKLRRERNRAFGSILEEAFYPHTVIQTYLKSRSHVLKLRQYSESEMQQIRGHILFGVDD